MKTYTELCQYATFEDRFHYLQLHGTVGYDTFGFDRWLNQSFYQSREWRQFRDRIIVRDAGCDLACKDHEITDWVIRNGKPIRPRIIIHHLNPLTKEDVLQHSDALLDPENVICVSDRTHKAICICRKTTWRHMPMEEMTCILYENSMLRKQHTAQTCG